MHFVYIIRSVEKTDKLYIGYTLDVLARLAKHNEGGSVYTKHYKPWELVWYCKFNDKSKALDFEKYLKSHMGKMFIEKRLL